MTTPNTSETDAYQIMTDNTGAEVILRHCQHIGTGPLELMAFFFKQMSELLYSGHGGSWIAFHNKCSAVYIEVDGKIVGNIIYSYIAEQKRTWVYLGSVDAAYRQRGLYSIMFREFESISRKVGAIEMSAHIHVDNMPILAASAKHGFLPNFSRMSKRLT